MASGRLLSLLAVSGIATAAAAGSAQSRDLDSIEARLSALKKRQAEIAKEINDLQSRRSKAKPLPFPNDRAGNVPADYEKVRAADATRSPISTQPYVRRNAFEAFTFLFPYSKPASAQGGASVQLTRDNLAHSTSLDLNAFLAYAIRINLDDLRSTSDAADVRNQIRFSEAAFAPFASFRGTLKDPKTTKERTAAQVGLDSQFLLEGGPDKSFYSTFRLLPYYQTDYRGVGSIEGFSAQWEPYIPGIHLGTTDIGRTGGQVIAYWFRAVPEVNFVHVGDAGYSNFQSNRDYAFLGATLQANAVLFENYQNVPEFLCGRISFAVSYAAFWESIRNKQVDDFGAAAAYDITKTKFNARCTAPQDQGESTAKSEPDLKTALTFTYNRGTDKNTLERRSKYVAGLTFQY